MSRHKMTREEAIIILGKYFGCEKRIHLCHGDCDKCKYDYDKYALRRAVEMAFKQLVGSEEVKRGRWKTTFVSILDGLQLIPVIECSECGHETNRENCSNYCPNCGAKMEE